MTLKALRRNEKNNERMDTKCRKRSSSHSGNYLQSTSHPFSCIPCPIPIIIGKKSFKAIIEEFELGFIKTHSLETLFDKAKRKTSVDIDIQQLMLLDQLYIDARYPGEMGLLPDGKPTIQEVTIFFELAKQIFETTKVVCV